MSSRPGSSPDMNSPKGNGTKFEERVQQIAATFSYPVAPDFTASERNRVVNRRSIRSKYRTQRIGLGLALLLIVLMSALLVSPARARVLDWIRIGSVRIFFSLPNPTDTPEGTSVPTPVITPTYLQSVLDLAGETSLAKAQEKADYTIQIPTYPPDLGQPDHVFLQQLSGPAVILVWINKDRPDQVRMTLSESSSDAPVFEKYDPKSVLETKVSGQPAVWIDGNYLLVMRNGEASLTRLVNQGHTLIWRSGDMTFRLETDVDLETAVRIAESMR